MKLLVAVMTCHRLDYYIDELTVEWNKNRCLNPLERVHAMRETWLSKLPAAIYPKEGEKVEIDYKFFYGRILRNPNQKPDVRNPQPVLVDRIPSEDEVFLNCGDNYTQNPAKFKEICKWALKNGYDYILRVDDDTFVAPDRLLQTDWASVPYSGSGQPNVLGQLEATFHPGGCLFLSAAAMQLVVDAKINNYADDVWVGEVMRKNAIPVHIIPTIWNRFGAAYNVVPSLLPAQTVEIGSAFHSCKPQAMRELYARIYGGK